MGIRIDDTLRNLRCPNEPEDKNGLLYPRERHEVFERTFRVNLTAEYLSNGRQWGFDRPENTIRYVEPLGPMSCATCGEEAEVTPWEYEMPVESNDETKPGWKQMAIE